MRLILLLIMSFLVTFSLACNNAAPPKVTKTETPKQPVATPQADTHNHAEDSNVARISLEDAKKAFDAGTAVFVDTRDSSSFDFKRIKGAVLVANRDFATGWQKIPKGKKIITYCSWRDEHTSIGLVRILNQNGILDAYALKGGTQAWEAAGFPMEGSAAKK